MPKYITVWLALTEARLDTSCMYVLPRHADPDYSSADAPVATAKAGEEVDVGTIVAYGHQHIRALPASPGDALFWSHRLIHWGSAPPMGMTNARRTLTWALADPSFEQPLPAVGCSAGTSCLHAPRLPPSGVIGFCLWELCAVAASLCMCTVHRVLLKARVARTDYMHDMCVQQMCR